MKDGPTSRIYLVASLAYLWWGTLENLETSVDGWTSSVSDLTAESGLSYSRRCLCLYLCLYLRVWEGQAADQSGHVEGGRAAFMRLAKLEPSWEPRFVSSHLGLDC